MMATSAGVRPKSSCGPCCGRTSTISIAGSGSAPRATGTLIATTRSSSHSRATTSRTAHPAPAAVIRKVDVDAARLERRAVFTRQLDTVATQAEMIHGEIQCAALVPELQLGDANTTGLVCIQAH